MTADSSMICECLELRTIHILENMECSFEPSGRISHLHNYCTWSRVRVFWIICDTCLTDAERAMKSRMSRKLYRVPNPEFFSPPFVSLREIYSYIAQRYFFQCCRHVQDMILRHLVSYPVTLCRPCPFHGATFTFSPMLRAELHRRQYSLAGPASNACLWLLQEPRDNETRAQWH